MVIKGLILKELRQSAVLIAVSMIILIGNMPFILWEDYSSFITNRISGPYEFDFSSKFFMGIILIISFSLAVGFLGSEKQRGSMDFTLALPYSRSTIFWTKWLTGICVIVVSLLLSYGITLLQLSLYHGTAINGSFLHYFCMTGVSLIMVFTLVFAAGCMTGTSLAQGIVAISTAMLPLLVVGVVVMNLYPFMEHPPSSLVNLSEEMAIFLAPSYFAYAKELSYTQMLAPLFMTLVYLIIGYASFLKQPMERNGYFFSWKQLNLPVFIIVVLLGTLGFGGISYGSSNSITGYVIGLLIGAGIGGTLGYFLIYKKAKL
ncbi:ABC transporter permease subunit [Metabacillus sp. FJAT-52054]|uniref:ABC transporter permease subunit n=1 Tax=Metabacillus sediminis TaxID=3117746 RepID=A0ABZ2NE83_9BACI